MRGSRRPSQIASGSAGTAIDANTARQPAQSAIRIPIGTPSTSDALIPMNTMPIARPRCAGAASSAARRVATRISIAQLAAISTRAANRLAYPLLAAANRFAAANVPSDASRAVRRSMRATTAAATSAASANTAEKIVVSWPAAATDT